MIDAYRFWGVYVGCYMVCSDFFQLPGCIALLLYIASGVYIYGIYRSMCIYALYRYLYLFVYIYMNIYFLLISVAICLCFAFDSSSSFLFFDLFSYCPPIQFTEILLFQFVFFVIFHFFFLVFFMFFFLFSVCVAFC